MLRNSAKKRAKGRSASPFEGLQGEGGSSLSPAPYTTGGTNMVASSSTTIATVAVAAASANSTNSAAHAFSLEKALLAVSLSSDASENLRDSFDDIEEEISRVKKLFSGTGLRANDGRLHNTFFAKAIGAGDGDGGSVSLQQGRISSRSSKIANPHADELERKAMEEEDAGGETGEEADMDGDEVASGTGKENKGGRITKRRKKQIKKKKKEKEAEKTPRVQEVSGEGEDDAGFFNLLDEVPLSARNEVEAEDGGAITAGDEEGEEVEGEDAGSGTETEGGEGRRAPGSSMFVSRASLPAREKKGEKQQSASALAMLQRLLIERAKGETKGVKGAGGPTSSATNSLAASSSASASSSLSSSSSSSSSSFSSSASPSATITTRKSHRTSRRKMKDTRPTSSSSSTSTSTKAGRIHFTKSPPKISKRDAPIVPRLRLEALRSPRGHEPSCLSPDPSKVSPPFLPSSPLHYYLLCVKVLPAKVAVGGRDCYLCSTARELTTMQSMAAISSPRSAFSARSARSLTARPTLSDRSSLNSAREPTCFSARRATGKDSLTSSTASVSARGGGGGKLATMLGSLNE